VKNKEILRWLASNWRTLESQAYRPRRSLAVDDEEDIRQVNAEMLSRFGYKREQPLMVQPPGKFFRATAATA
jgi:hypothetical protein